MPKLFRLRTNDQAQAGPSPAEMRGRAAEISDAGALDWAVLWEALKTEPPAERPATITQELGLDEETDVRRGWETLPGTEFSGTRHGRSVALRIGVVPSIRGKGMNEVEVDVAVASFRINAVSGRLVAEPGARPEVEEALAELEPSPKVWRDVVVEGGPEGIRARRPVTSHPQGYVYDLWLVERLADRPGA
jgi:hypothetical protein